MYQKKRKYEIFAIACILGMVMYIAGNKWSSQAQAADYQKHMAQEILRLHVIANSDSEEDQTLKMKVKEGVVSYVSTLTQV